MLDFVQPNVAYNYVTTNVTAAPAYEPPRGPHEPNQWLGIEDLEDGTGELAIMRTDSLGYKYAYLYVIPGDLEKIGPMVMAWLAKREHEGRGTG